MRKKPKELNLGYLTQPVTHTWLLLLSWCFEILENLGKDKILTKDEAVQTLLYPTPADFWFYSDI